MQLAPIAVRVVGTVGAEFAGMLRANLSDTESHLTTGFVSQFEDFLNGLGLTDLDSVTVERSPDGRLLASGDHPLIPEINRTLGDRSDLAAAFSSDRMTFQLQNGSLLPLLSGRNLRIPL